MRYPRHYQGYVCALAAGCRASHELYSLSASMEIIHFADEKTLTVLLVICSYKASSEGRQVAFSDTATSP